jgi:hypothetical protein
VNNIKEVLSKHEKEIGNLYREQAKPYKVVKELAESIIDQQKLIKETQRMVIALRSLFDLNHDSREKKEKHWWNIF